MTDSTREGRASLKDFLDEKVAQFNTPDFITDDPVSVPHQYTLKQDIEIAGFLAATFAWGQRKTIINKSNEILALMDNAPFDFVKHHEESDLKRFLNFKHRTFNDTDALYFLEVFRQLYNQFDSMEQAFVIHDRGDYSMKARISGFHDYFFSLPEFPARTRKHVATPARNSACKRINMFLRWMVRKDKCGVDFGIWDKIKPAELICPCDLHVDKIARRLGLITRKQTDWQTAVELTDALKRLDPNDPVKYDFALFGIGVLEKF